MFIGVHLAWSEHGRSGLAAIEPEGDVVGLWAATSDADIISWVEDYGGPEFVLAMDAPLVVRHQAGTRPCEQALEMAFHEIHPAAYPLSAHLRAFAGGVRPTRLTQALHVDTSLGSPAARRAIEVYPDPAMIPLFGLTGTLGFRRGATAERVAALNQVLDLVEGLSTRDVPLRVTVCSAWEEIRTFVDEAHTHDQLQEAVDLVDAILCGYVAMYAERAPELTYTFGDAETGFIVTPVSSEMKQALESAVVDGRVEGGGSPPSTRAVASSVRSGTPAGAGSAGRAGPASSGGTGSAVVPTAPVYLTQTTDRSSAQRLDDDEVLAMFAKLRRYGSDGTRSPHRALLALTALGRFARSRTSISPFSEIQPQLTRLISVFGPPVPSGAVLPSAADTFTELGREGVWVLDAQVTADESTPLRADVSGRFAPEIEAALGRSSRLGARVARLLVDLNFPETLTGDVLAAAGLDPDPIRRSGDVARSVPTQRRPRAGWFTDVLDAWQGRCAFCGFDGHVGSVAVGLEAAHVRWFALDGPDHVDNGLALCSLHHKLFDSGVLGLDQDYCVNVSGSFSGRSTAALAVRDLQDVQLDPPNGATLPAAAYVEWHNREVFKGA